ncbi:hypothetical protein AB6N24_06130 [Cellulomonas sp. 179-A 4D5 NHS]|uniref:hypothetical protein n=1 Tax=Cellulomonas sp. 179-A 4D5 NHS TaxID=3142378 RepID=UPI0039A17AD0
MAAREGREPQLLVHAVLEVMTGKVVRTVDMSPIWGKVAERRDVVVAVGPVGSRSLKWCPLFRYEVRVVHGVGGLSAPVHVSDRFLLPGCVLDDLAEVPAYTWGRDDAGTGEMWTSNSVVAWLLERSGVSTLEPPAGHRAPGWEAGVLMARG